MATAPYPAASFRPMARPRRAGPARSIFMITVVDQVRPWLTPSSTLAATTQPQLGAQISSGGMGSAASQPAGPSPAPAAGARRGRSRGALQRQPGGVRPLRRAAGQDRHGGVPGPLQQAGGGGGPLAVPAHGHDLPRPHLGGLAGERAELDVAGAGQVPVGVLAGLPYVDDGG